MQSFKKVLAVFLVLTAIALTASCDNEEIGTSLLANHDPKITEAKEWFESYKSNSETSKSEEGEFNQAFRNLDYYWENAKVIKLNGNTTGITVPVKDNPENPNYKGQKMLYLYESDSKFQAILQEIFPESKEKIDYEQKRQGFGDLTLFSGYIINWDLKKGFLKGARLKDGLVVADVTNVMTLFGEDASDSNTAKMIEMFDDSAGIGSERDDTLQRGGGAGAIPLKNVIVEQKSPPRTPKDFSIAGAFGDGGSGGNSGTPTGGGSNGDSPEPVSPPANKYVINKNKLCGTYNFKKIGNAYVANISGLGFSASSPSGDKIFSDLPTVCVTIPNYNLSITQCSSQFNIAWTNTMNELMTYLNNTSGIINPTPWKLRELILQFLTANMNYSAGLNSGVSIITGTCSGVSSSTALYCK